MADLITTIARARASMMLRGHTDLRLCVGPDCWKVLKTEIEVFDVMDQPAPRVFGIPITVADSMEGWVVVGSIDL